MKVILTAISKLISTFLLLYLLIFLPAGSINFINGWIFIALLLFLMIFTGIYLALKKPELLKKRLDSKETEKSQVMVIIFSSIIFTAGFVVAGLDYRFSISKVPNYLVYMSCFILFIGYLLYIEVLKENEYLSRTVKVYDSQKVIDTGLYSIIRHPMYISSLLTILPIPIILGSYISFLIFLIYLIIIIFRIISEEKYLKKELPGYQEYTKKVKYRLIPYIW